MTGAFYNKSSTFWLIFGLDWLPAIDWQGMARIQDVFQIIGEARHRMS
jgi:hypothetical protein